MLRGTGRRVEVHCWGGLGSQLFALALIYDLQLRFPRRIFVLVLHSSGVTRRAQEISSLPFAPAYEFQDDFKVVDTSTQFSSKRSIIRKFIKKLLLRIGFLAEANDDSSYSKVKPWVRQFRGHYSRRQISADFIQSLDSYLDNYFGFDSDIQSKVSIHYRLGDLLHLDEKGPIPPQRLAKEISRVHNLFPGEVALKSDSLIEAQALLAPYLVNPVNYFHAASTLEVMYRGRSAAYFIGTSSKISYWIILLRMVRRSPSIGSMPDSDKTNLDPLFEKGMYGEVHFY